MGSRSRRGVAAWEFALAAPPLITLIMLLLETGWQTTTEIALEHGAHDAIRFALTGGSTISGLSGAPSCRSGTIVWLVTHGAPGLLQAQYLTVTTSSNGGQATASSGSGFAGTAASTVTYSFIYNQPYIEPFAGPILKNKSFQHSITMTVQNEPYPNTPC